MIGTDFELFMKAGSDLIPVPEHLDIGSKEGKHVQLHHGTMHRDNVMVELCPDPVVSTAGFVHKITSLVDEAEEFLSKRMGETISLAFEPTAQFGTDMLASRFAQEIGCDPDWVAANGQGSLRDKLNAGMLGNTRCAGGHLHMSYKSVAGDFPPEPLAVHLADLTLGALEVTMGTQGTRRDYYGMPGLYRPTKYNKSSGVEYRTLSNRWLGTKGNIKAMSVNALSTEKVLRFVKQKELLEFLQTHWSVLQAQGSIINENVEECVAALTEVRDRWPEYNWVTGV